MAPFHVALWNHVWAIQPGKRPRPRIECWFRDSAKTTSAELAITALGCTGRRTYAVYVARTQDLANDKVQNVASHFESETLPLFYPEHADRRLGKFGHSRAWRRNRLATRGGFVLDALGLDTAARGLKFDKDRPDLFIIDDVDENDDSLGVILKHERRITRKVIPARAPHAAVFFFQNLIHDEGVMARRLNGKTNWLADAIITGPIPAVEDLEYERRTEKDGTQRWFITGGRATWEGFDLEASQTEINTSGITSFLAEHQHEPQDAEGGMFSHLDFEAMHVHVKRKDCRTCRKRDHLPELDDVVVWVDPASEGEEGNSCQAVAALGLDRRGRFVILRAWEKHGTPLEALRTAFRFAIDEGANSIGVETDTGGKAWQSVFNEAKLEAGPAANHIRYRHTKAAGKGSKPERASRMLTAFERDQFRILEGQHNVVERALRRFPKQEPHDLVDVLYHAWDDLRGELPETGVMEHYDPTTISPV